MKNPAALLIVALGLCACGSIGAGPEGPSEDGTETDVDNANPGDNGGNGGVDNGGNGDVPGNNGGEVVDPNQPCTQLAIESQQVLSTHCASCHGAASPGKGGFNTVLDINALLSSGKIKAGDPDNSPLYLRMSTGSMPPAEVSTRPSASEVSTVRAWIACGAVSGDPGDGTTAEFMSIDKRVRLLLDDVRSFSSDADRERLRYIDFSHLSNAGYSASQIDQYRESVALLLNSVSYASTVVPPEAVDKDKLLYRIDLRDYGFSEATWDQITTGYPYAVQYDQNSQLFPYDEVTAEQLRVETGEDIPYIQADWFITHASQPPLYYDLLGFNGTFFDITADLGIDVNANVQNLDVARAGFAKSGVSVNNRMMERHELPGNQGAFWLSYDFGTNIGDANLFANPLDFIQDGGEAFFNLPNGLQAYVLLNAAGTLLDIGPTNIVTDPNSRTGAVVPGLSCMSNCHFTDGTIPKNDEIRAFQEDNAQDRNELAIVRELYIPIDDMSALLKSDSDRYTRAKTQLGVVKSVEKTMQLIVNSHLNGVDLNGAAAILGVTSEELQQALDATPQAFPPEVVALRNRGGNLNRDVFEAVFNDFIVALGIGQPLVVVSN